MQAFVFLSLVSLFTFFTYKEPAPYVPPAPEPALVAIAEPASISTGDSWDDILEEDAEETNEDPEEGEDVPSEDLPPELIEDDEDTAEDPVVVEESDFAEGSDLSDDPTSSGSAQATSPDMGSPADTEEDASENVEGDDTNSEVAEEEYIPEEVVVDPLLVLGDEGTPSDDESAEEAPPEEESLVEQLIESGE
jgi:hypothetical protein